MRSVQGDRIALHAHNSHGIVVASPALAKLGAIVVPINFMLGPDEVRFILEHSGATSVIVEDALVDVMERALTTQAAGLRCMNGDEPADVAAGWESLHQLMAYGDASEPDIVIADDDPVAIIYTSGTQARAA
jgi:fatty-acyl-CoA synthase